MNILRDKNKILYVVVCIGILFVVLASSRHAFEYETEATAARGVYFLVAGEKISQTVTGIEGTFKGFSVQYGVSPSNNSGDIKIALDRNGSLVQEWDISCAELVNNEYQAFYLKKSINSRLNDVYIIHVLYEGMPDSTVIYLSNVNSDLSVGSEKVFGNSICYKFICENRDVKNGFLIMNCFFVLLVIAVGMACFEFKKIHLKRMLVVMGLTALFLEFFMYDIMQNIENKVVMNPAFVEGELSEIEPGEKKEYEIKITNTPVEEMKFFLINAFQIEDVWIKLVSADTNEQYMDRFLEEQQIVWDESKEKYAIKITASDCENHIDEFGLGNYILYITNQGGDSIFATVYDSDDRAKYILNLQTKYTNIGYYLAYSIAIVLVTYLIIICGALTKNKLSPESFFLYTIIPFSVIYMVLILPWSTPDAGEHFRAAYRFSNIILGLGGKTEWTGRIEDVLFYHNIWTQQRINSTLGGYSTILYNLKLGVEQMKTAEFLDDVSYMSFYSVFCYMPQVLGLCIGRILGLGSVITVYIGRLFLLVAYILGCYHAIKTAPAGKIVFATIPLLPMSLMLASAYSYDGICIIAALNFIACIFRLCLQRNEEHTLIECCFWTFVLGAVKGGGYLLILPLVFMIIIRRKEKCINKAVYIIFSGITSVLLFDLVLTWGEQLFQFGGDAAGKYSAALAWRNPIQYINMMMDSYFSYADALMINMGGIYLEWLEDTIPAVIVVGFMLVIGIYSIFEQDELQFDIKDKVFMCIVIMAEMLLTPIMLLSWTDVGAERVEGLQGRYYLPVLPLIIFALTKFKLKNAVGKVSPEENLGEVKAQCYRYMAGLSCICVVYMMKKYLLR